MARPALSAVAELLKPITWFTPMWAFACGVVAADVPVADRQTRALAGGILAGLFPTSQAVHDGFDRPVGAAHERGVPSCVTGLLISALALRSASTAA